MSFGWSGQILRVDLSNGQSQTEDTEPYTESFIGGKGINLKIIYDEVGPEIAAFDPANRLCFGPGVLTGTLAPAAGRMKVTSVSPHGRLASSGIGGFIGAEIRHAGYDNLVVQGRSEEPVYLHIHDDAVDLRDAAHIWGKGTQETQRLIKEEIGDSVEIVCIGPAGENLVTFGCILTGMGSTAGRHGLGAIMGSKRLKAIALQGTRPIRIAKPEEFVSTCEEAHKWLRESESMQGQAVEGQGDRHTLPLGYAGGTVPFGNWEPDADWDEVPGFDGADEFWNQYAVHQYGCIGCPVNHFHVFHIPGVGTGLTKCAGWGAFAANVWTNDRKVMFHASHLCNHYGLDVTSTGNAISFLMELYHKGIITEKDTDGLPMTRGDENAILATVHKIGKQEGFGKLFKDGVLGAAKKIGKGAEECAMVVNGEAIEPYEVRAYKSEALGAALNSGNIGDSLTFEYGYYYGDPEPVEKFAEEAYGTREAAVPSSYEGKAVSIWDCENQMVVCDMLGACGWVFINWTGGGADTSSLEVPAKLFSLATGRDTSEAELLVAAQRCKTLERAFDVRRGKRRTDDSLPRRMFETAVLGGRLKGERLDRERFEKMVDEYYALRGWDSQGIPTPETFERFGLSAEGKIMRQELEQKGSGKKGARS
jgi:aldehyde:ferredoxin oxidoreductase